VSTDYVQDTPTFNLFSPLGLAFSSVLLNSLCGLRTLSSSPHTPHTPHTPCFYVIIFVSRNIHDAFTSFEWLSRCISQHGLCGVILRCHLNRCNPALYVVVTNVHLACSFAARTSGLFSSNIAL